MQELQIPMKKVELAYPYVQAIEVTPQFIHSLPSCGATMQRFGEQVEILNPGPVPKKVYAVLGEYIVTFDDSNDKATYIIVSAVAFKSLFRDHEEATEAPPLPAPPPAPPLAPPLGTAELTPVTVEPPPAKPLSAAEKAAAEKEEKRKERLKELEGNDMGITEAGVKPE